MASIRPAVMLTDKEIHTLLMKEFNNEFGVAAIIGNLAKESGLRSDNAQNSCMKKMGITDEIYVERVNNGTYTAFCTDRVGFGFAQWTSAGRKTGLFEYTVQKGISIADGPTQISWLIHELKTKYKAVYNTVKNAKTIKEASDMFVLKFEVPASVLPSASEERKNATLNERLACSEGYYNKFKSTNNNSIESATKKEEQVHMSNSSLVSFTQISPNRHSPRNHEIDTVSIHCYVGQVTVERMGAGFAPSSRQASCNYGVDKDGRIGMYCPEGDRSWCTSSASNDNRAITIEVACDNKPPYAINDVAMQSLIKLLADICRRNPKIKQLRWQGNKALIGQVSKQNMTVHRWFANKSCPGDYLYSRHGYIADSVNKLLGINTNYAKYDSVKVQTEARNYLMLGDNSVEVGKLQTNLNYLGYNCGMVDNSFGSKTDAALKKFQHDYHLEEDGKYGPATKSALEAAVAKKKEDENKKYSGPTYTVKQGQSLSTIGSIVGIPWKTIAKLNDIKSPYVIKAGQVLKLSDASVSTSVSSSTTKPSTSSTSKKSEFISDGVDYSAVFDPTFYVNHHSDLKKAIGTNKTKLFQHFIKHGISEGRQSCATFNVRVYQSRYSDLRKQFGDDLKKYYIHYINFGKREGRTAI